MRKIMFLFIQSHIEPKILRLRGLRGTPKTVQGNNRMTLRSSRQRLLLKEDKIYK